MSWLRFLFKKVVDIRPGEKIKTGIMFFYFFALIATVWMLKPVRNSLFLEELGASNLRYVYMGEGLFLIAVVWLFVKYSKIVGKRELYSGVLLASIATLLIFWFLFKTQMNYLSVFFYVWASSYSIVMTTQFFTLANDIFNPLEAKRLFGFILSGGSLGGVLGGMATQQLAPFIGTENLLLVIAGVIGLCYFMVMSQWSRLDGVRNEPEEQQAPDRKKPQKSPKKILSGRKILMGSSYLLMLLGLVMIAKMTSTIIDNQFNASVELAVQGKDARTAFYGGFFSFLNALSFIMQLVATSLIFKYLGVGIALWILPLGLLAGSAGTVLYPVLAASIFLKAFDGSTNYSIQQASREVLYLPVPSNVRYRVKPINDMLGYRISKSLGGVFIALAAPLLSLPDHRLGILVLFLLPFWFCLAYKLRKGYSTMLRKNILEKQSPSGVAESQRATDVVGLIYSEKTIQSAKQLFNHESRYTRKLASTAYGLYLRSGKNLDVVRRILENLIQEEGLKTQFGEIVKEERAINDKDIRFLEDLLVSEAQKKIENKEEAQSYFKDFPEEALMRLSEILQDPEGNLEIKRRAIRILEVIPKQEVVDLIFSSLPDTQRHALRFLKIRALNRIHSQTPALIMNRFLIKQEIARETAIYGEIQDLIFFVHKRVKDPERMDYLAVALQAISDESIERIFRFLDLLYPQEMIQIIHDRLIERSGDERTKAHAIELLNNIVGPDMQRLIGKIFKIPAQKFFDEMQVVSYLKKFSDSRDPWFRFLSIILISEMGINQKEIHVEDVIKEI